MKGGESGHMNNQEFEALVRQYEKLVFTVCYQLVKDYGEAQNLTQETFLSAYRHIDSCQDGNYKPWLIRIASNKSKDFLKSAYHRRVDTVEEWDAVPLLPEGSAEQKSISREGARLVAEAVLSLDEPYHKVAKLYFLEERPVDEIARLLGRPRKTVETQLYRARQKLQRILVERGILV
jgi:RNA polymerase sigma-70 factor (ECF subfamily)